MTFEQYLQQYRPQFDSVEIRDSAELWAKIVAKLEQQTTPDDEIDIFLKENRSAFDSAVPKLNFWAAIDTKLANNTQNIDLEGFIQKNKIAFDSETPSATVWNAIEAKLPTEQKKTHFLAFTRHLRVAAAVLALLVTGAGIGIGVLKSMEKTSSLTEVSSEYAEMEQYYSNQIKAKTVQLAAYQPKAEEIKPIEDDLKQIDAMMAELRKELENAPKGSQEQVVNAMIENYKTKVEILERVLNNLHYYQQKQQQPQGIQKNEKSDI